MLNIRTILFAPYRRRYHEDFGRVRSLPRITCRDSTGRSVLYRLGLCLLVTGCGGGSDGGSIDASLERRSAGSLHRLSWSEPAPLSSAQACTNNIVLRLKNLGQTVTLAADVGSSGEIVVPTRENPGEIAQTYFERTCDGTSKPIGKEYVIVASEKVSNYVWERITDNADFPGMDGAGGVVYRGRMWLIGGWRPSEPINFPRITSNAVWSSVDGIDWNLEKPNTYTSGFSATTDDWAGRHTAGYGVLADEMFIAGGDGVSGAYQTDFWTSPSGQKWILDSSASGENPLDRRLLFNTFVHGGKVCIFGGQTIPSIVNDSDEIYSDIWCRESAKNWERLVTDNSPFGRSGILGEAVLNNTVWILGGGVYEWPVSTAARRYNDVWKSDNLKQWTKVLEHAPWEGRLYHNVAAYDDRIWVLAGYNQDNLSDVWYSKDGFNWYQLPTPWAARHAASVFVHQDALWIAAGSTSANDKPQPNDVWRLRRTPP